MYCAVRPFPGTNRQVLHTIVDLLRVAKGLTFVHLFLEIHRLTTSMIAHHKVQEFGVFLSHY